ncbi:uncharacterized protein LOC125664477 isoform X2 [Ostrea edulis]|nr:uncharacterized protein LOC125664477 isoform X2 [Ostrea edulis]
MAEIMCQGMSSNNEGCKKLNSTCCYNEYFDKGAGSCVDCALGSFGWNCKESCVSGYYGYLCRSECECDAHHCDSATGCKRDVHKDNTSETMFHNDSTAETIRQEAGPTEVTKNYVQTSISRLTLTSTTRVKEDVPEDSDHHDKNQWISVSFLLIGSLATIFIFGILFYLRTTRRCKIGSRYPELDGINVQEEVDDEDPADTTLAEEGQTDDYAEIRYSQFNVCSITFRTSNNTTYTRGEIGACGIGNRTKQNVYDRYDDCEYSRLQLRKKQSRIFSQDGTQKPGYLNQDEEVCMSLKPSELTNYPFTKANTLPRNSHINIGDYEHNTECYNDIIHSTSESQVRDFQQGSPKSLIRMEFSMTREKDDITIDIEDRPYSFVRL